MAMAIVGPGIIGFTVGAMIGVVTRPSFLGFPIPLELLISPSPMDQPLKELLFRHIGLAGVAGAIGFIALSYFWSHLQNTTSNAQAHPFGGSFAPTPQAAPATSDHAARWNTLVEYDPELREARNKLAAYGKPYVELLAREFLSVNDKQYLPAMVSRIEAQALAELEAEKNRPVRNGK